MLRSEGASSYTKMMLHRPQDKALMQFHVQDTEGLKCDSIMTGRVYECYYGRYR